MWSRLAQVEQGEALVAAVLAMANACEKIGRGAEAIPWLQEALHQMPGHAPVLARLAQLLQASGKAVEAAQLQIQMAEAEADEGARYPLLVRAAETLLGAGGFPAAAQALEKAVALRPTERAARSLLIDAYVGMGELDRGAEALDGLLAEAKVTANPIEDSKASAVAYFRLGRIAHKARDKARAIIFVKQALQEDPGMAEAKALLDELK